MFTLGISLSIQPFLFVMIAFGTEKIIEITECKTDNITIVSNAAKKASSLRFSREVSFRACQSPLTDPRTSLIDICTLERTQPNYLHRSQ